LQEWLRAVAAIFVFRREVANLTSPTQPTPAYTALSILKINDKEEKKNVGKLSPVTTFLCSFCCNTLFINYWMRPTVLRKKRKRRKKGRSRRTVQIAYLPSTISHKRK